MTESELPECPGNLNPSIVVIDAFYDNPDYVRELALKAEYNKDTRFYKGTRSIERFRLPFLKERVEKALNINIKKWDMETNGRFQYTTVLDPLVYHRDSQLWAGAVYLTPNAPILAGTSFYVQTDNGVKYDEDHIHFDKTMYTEVDKVANFYNRAVFWRGNALHSASANFGDKLENARLSHIFFFE